MREKLRVFLHLSTHKSESKPHSKWKWKAPHLNWHSLDSPSIFYGNTDCFIIQHIFDILIMEVPLVQAILVHF